jgi:cellulose synthase/poly-beta-1,6-N-acetylglucosamine synthase-like glycosyltransferase
MAALWDEICASIRYAISVTVVLAIFLYAVEPSVLLLQALIMSHPLIVDVPPPAATSLGAHQKDNPRIAVVIACHKSEDTIVATIRSCRNHFDDCQIFVMNNRNGPECLTESTRSVIDKHALHKVNYIYNPMGNKTLAFYAGAIAAKDFQYILLMDDDVHLPRHMSFDCNVFDEKVKAVCYPIRAVHPSGDDGSSSLFIQWQALEYKTSDYTKLLQSYLSTVLYPHGAISLWERETLIECLRQHDTIFYADDVKVRDCVCGHFTGMDRARRLEELTVLHFLSNRWVSGSRDKSWQ